GHQATQHPRNPPLFPYTTLFRSLPAQAQISGGFRETSAPGKERTVGLVDAKAHPLRYVEIGGGARFRDGFVDTDRPDPDAVNSRSEEHTSELQSLAYLVCRLLLE